MKINNNKTLTSPNARLDNIKGKQSEAAKGLNREVGLFDDKEAVGNSASVNVSDQAQFMQKAKDIATQSTVDEAKVARLQKLIDDGKYKVDADKIADRLVDEHLGFPD